ncbi:MAG: phosphatase PAP2 family protein [Flavisolibacter sp.]
MMNELLALDLWSRLDAFDKWLFVKVNSGLANPFFDAVLPFFRNADFWIPLYLFIFVFVLANFGKKGFLWFLAFLCTVALTDLTGTYLFKETVQRLRPCQDLDFFFNVRLVVKHCSGSYSFLSNHAANHFGMATFIVVTFANRIGLWSWLFLLWAFSIAFAQVYVGVHYPGDVLAGAVLGIGYGILVARVYNKNAGFVSLDK